MQIHKEPPPTRPRTSRPRWRRFTFIRSIDCHPDTVGRFTVRAVSERQAWLFAHRHFPWPFAVLTLDSVGPEETDMEVTADGRLF